MRFSTLIMSQNGNGTTNSRHHRKKGGTTAICVGELHFFGFILHSEGGSTAISTLPNPQKKTKTTSTSVRKTFQKSCKLLFWAIMKTF